MSAFLSGEMKDTVQVNPAGAYGAYAARSYPSKIQMLTVHIQVLERFFSKKERATLFRSWVGSASMWIKVSRVCAKSLGDLGSTTSNRVVTPFGEIQLTRRMMPMGLIIHMGNLSHFGPS